MRGTELGGDWETILALVIALAAGLAGVYMVHRTIEWRIAKNAPEPTRDVSRHCPGCDAPEELDMDFCPVCGRKYDERS